MHQEFIPQGQIINHPRVLLWCFEAFEGGDSMKVTEPVECEELGSSWQQWPLSPSSSYLWVYCQKLHASVLFTRFSTYLFPQDKICNSKVTILTLLLRSRANSRKFSTQFQKTSPRPDSTSGRNTSTAVLLHKVTISKETILNWSKQVY